MAPRRKPSPLMGAATAMLDGVSDMIVREDSRFRHSMEIAIDRVRPDPEQPRKMFDDTETTMLAQTMADQGQLQPILVRRDPDIRGHWLIVAGERRWRAAVVNGWPTILGIEHAGDAEVAMLIENLQRVDLAVVEEARGLQRLIDGKGWSQTRAAQVLGKTESEVSSTLRILTLPENLLDDLLMTKNSGSSRYVLAELARVEDGPMRDRLIRAARDGMLTQRMIRSSREDEMSSADEPRLPRRTQRLSLRMIDNFIDSLTALRDKTGDITANERTGLNRLRGEIDRVLQTSPEAKGLRHNR